MRSSEPKLSADSSASECGYTSLRSLSFDGNACRNGHASPEIVVFGLRNLLEPRES